MILRCLIPALAAVCVLAQEAPEVNVEKVRGNVYVLYGNGGNIGLCMGEDGAFLIDDQYAPATPQIRKAVKSVGDQPIKFVINTHWHGDHTGGNENMGKADAIIFAHENVRKRMSSEQLMEDFNRTVPASPKEALPVVTFTRDIDFHLNGETIHAMHLSNAHTDGDAIIIFKETNVIHTGDIFFNGMYPFIDRSSGGSVDGMIAAVNRIIDMADGGTKIIPGHGPQTDKKGLIAYRDMLVEVRGNIKTLKDEGKSLEDTVAANPTAKYDEKLGGGYFKPEAFVMFVYKTVK